MMGTMLSDEAMSSEQQKILRGMTPGQRWSAARQLYWTMRRRKAAFLTSQHPGWSDERVRQEVYNLSLNARS